MSKKLWPILYSNLLYKMGHYFLDTQYTDGSSEYFANVWLKTGLKSFLKRRREGQGRTLATPSGYRDRKIRRNVSRISKKISTLLNCPFKNIDYLSYIKFH